MEHIEIALRHIFRDTDGRMYAPVTADHNRPYIYLPGHNVHYNGYEVHHVLVYVNAYNEVTDLELLCDNGYTVNKDEPVIARLIQQLA